MKTLIAILQIICIIAVVTGIVIEAIYQAHLGFILITVGAFFFGISEKTDHYRHVKQINNLNKRKD